MLFTSYLIVYEVVKGMILDLSCNGKQDKDSGQNEIWQFVA